MEALQVIANRTKRIDKFIAIAMPIAILIGAGYWIYLNVYRPYVKIVEIDYKKGIATVKIGTKERHIYKGSITAAGGGWGVRFGPYGYDEEPNRIELVKDDLVYRVF